MRKTITLKAVLFKLALRTVLDRYGPPTRDSTVLRGTDRFRTVLEPF